MINKQAFPAFILFFLFLPFLFSCENDTKEVNKLTKTDSIPVQTADTIEVFYSEMGYLKFKLNSPYLINCPGEDAYNKFPKGFKVIMYDSLKREKNELTANYGVKYERRKIMEATGNVILINKLKGEKLTTEHLVWDEKTRKIYSDRFVTIRTPDKIIYGEGLVSDEKFDNWKIKRVRGTFYVNE